MSAVTVNLTEQSKVEINHVTSPVVSITHPEVRAITVTGFVGGSGGGFTLPDGLEYQVLTSDGAGGATFEFPKTISETVKNVSGGELAKGTPVHVTGSTGQDTAEVVAADATTYYPAHFVLGETLGIGEVGQAIAYGFINNVSVPDGDAYVGFEGEDVYLGASGGWVTTKPTGANVKVQKIGVILKVNASSDHISGIVQGAGRVNDLPNITEGKLWVGDADGVPQEWGYSNATAMPEEVGAFPVGTTFSDATLDQLFTGLLYPYQDPVLTVNDNFAQEYEFGDDVNSVTITLSADNPSNIETGSLSILKYTGISTYTTIATGLSLSDFSGGYIYSPATPITSPANGYVSFRVMGLDTNGSTISDYGPNTYWRYRVFWGNSSSSSLSVVSTLSDSILDANRGGTRAFDSGTSVYKFFAWPTGLGAPSASPNGFKFDNGTNVPMATSNDDANFSTTDSSGYYYQSITETVNGESITYRVYRSKNQINGALNITVY
jgi:hypothetical protein